MFLERSFQYGPKKNWQYEKDLKDGKGMRRKSYANTYRKVIEFMLFIFQSLSRLICGLSNLLPLSQFNKATLVSFYILTYYVSILALCTVRCKETRLFGIFLYKMVIFTSLKIILKVEENLPFLSHFFISI